MPIWKSRSQAQRDGDALYAPAARDAIKGFLANHGGHANTDGILAYMAEMYDVSEATVRQYLSEMTRDGELTHPPANRQHSAAIGERGRSYDLAEPADYYNGDDGR